MWGAPHWRTPRLKWGASTPIFQKRPEFRRSMARLYHNLDFCRGETAAEVSCRLVDEKKGGDAKHSEYEHLRATRLQLRCAQDLVTVTVIQYFFREGAALCHPPTIRNGGLVRHVSELNDRSAESIASSASKDDFTRLSAVVRKLGFGSPGGMQQDG